MRAVVAVFVMLMLSITDAMALTLYCEFDNLGPETYVIDPSWQITVDEYIQTVDLGAYIGTTIINRKTQRASSNVRSKTLPTTRTDFGMCKDITGARNKF